MSDVERTSAGLQMIIPGCERRTLPKSTTRVDGTGQGLLHFYTPPNLREQLESQAEAPLRPRRGQRAMPKSGLFSSSTAPAPPFAAPRGFCGAVTPYAPNQSIHALP